MKELAEHALPAGRYSVPTLNWLRMPVTGSAEALPPVFDLAEILDGIASAGFQAVGLDDVTVGDLSPDDVAAALRGRGLACSEVGILRAGASGQTAAAAHRLAALARATGTTCCIAIVADPPPRHPLASLEVAAAVLEDAGVRLALEFASYGPVATLADAIELCAAVGWERCGILLDSWHALRGAADWGALDSLAGEQIALVHLNDAPRDAGSDPVLDSRFRREPPGTGILDLARFLGVLQRSGYSGAVSLEILSSRIAAAPPMVIAHELMAALTKAGLVRVKTGRAMEDVA